MISTFENINENNKKNIADVLYEGFKEKLLPILKNFDESDRPDIARQLLTFNQGIFYEENEQVLGAALLDSKKLGNIVVDKKLRRKIGFFKSLFLSGAAAPPKSKETLKLNLIAVSSKARGKGVGTKMMEYIFQYAREKNFKKITLDVVDSNEKAKKLYESLGFTVKKKIWTALFTAGIGCKYLYVMEKTITRISTDLG